MLVKKFEARTMKEALEMVKKELGPDAIILSARDHKRSFGLVGAGSVEITAAVPAEHLQKKKYVESRMRPEDRERLQSSSIKTQREVIEKATASSMSSARAPSQNSLARKPVASHTHAANGYRVRPRYIDIDDDGGVSQFQNYSQESSADYASERIKTAAQRAWSAMGTGGSQSIAGNRVANQPPPSRGGRYNTNAAGVNNSASAMLASDSATIKSLQSEIETLRKTIAQFQQVPQTILPGSAASVYPGSDFGLKYEVAAMYEKLTHSGMSPEIVAEILTQAQEQMQPIRLKNTALVDAWVAKYILDHTLIAEPNHSKVQVFMGPSASGKSSTLVKYAAHLVVKESKKIAIVSADTLKVGAVDQMRIFAQILNVPFAVVRNQLDWHRVLAALTNVDYILVDFPGLGLKSVEELSWVKNLLPPKELEPALHLVLSCLTKDSDLTEIGKRYKVTDFKDVIFTNIDESIQHGSIYNFMTRFHVGIHSFGCGPKVPEDYEVASRERLLDLIFKLSKMSKT